MLVESPDALRTWLTNEMAPICDAEPTALAKYVLALLRKDKAEAELIEFCIEQLDVFLQTKARSFVEKLFAVIKDRSYLPDLPLSITSGTNKASKSSPAGSEKKREFEERKESSKEREDEKKKMIGQVEKDRKSREDKEVEKPAATEVQKTVRKRISPPAPTIPREEIRRDHSVNRADRRRSRSPRDRRVDRIERPSERRTVNQQVARATHRLNERYKNERLDRVERKRSPYERARRDRSSDSDQRKKKRCRDYDEKGFCMKGDQCMYDHGPDPVVVDDIALEKMVGTGGKSVAAVAQIAPNFSVPPPGYTPLNPPPPGVDSVYGNNTSTVPSVGVAEGYNPEAPALSASSVSAAVQAPSINFSIPPPPLPAAVVSNATPWQQASYSVPSLSGTVLIHPTANVYDPTQSSLTPAQVTPSHAGIANRRGRGGAVVGGVHKFSQNIITNKTLEVRKVPVGMNNIAKLNEHFAQFGQIVNIQVCYDGDPEAALITYLSRHEAISAYKSTMPILNNRFIKVFWHNDSSQNSSPPSQAQSTAAHNSAVTMNARGSLTRTVHLSARSSDAMNEATQSNANTPSGDGPKFFQSGRTVVNHSATAANKLRYVEVRRRRKQDKENKMRLVDLHRRKCDLLAKDYEQQKIVIEKIQATTDTKKRKALMQLLKRLDSNVKTQKEEILSLAEKISKLNSDTDAKKENESDAASSKDVSETYVGEKRAHPEGKSSIAEMPVTVKKMRPIDSTQSVDNRSRVVAVCGFKSEDIDAVVYHMENFGEIVDMEFSETTQNTSPTAFFTYKKRREAEEAVALGSDFAHGTLVVKLAPKRPLMRDVVPDEKRVPSEQVTPAALLATCPLDESDDEGNDEN